jgi:hypothetical protein
MMQGMPILEFLSALKILRQIRSVLGGFRSDNCLGRRMGRLGIVQALTCRLVLRSCGGNYRKLNESSSAPDEGADDFMDASL